MSAPRVALLPDIKTHPSDDRVQVLSTTTDERANEAEYRSVDEEVSSSKYIRQPTVESEEYSLPENDVEHDPDRRVTLACKERCQT